MSWILEYFVVELPIVLLYLLCLMLSVSHAIQNEKKVWKFTQSDSVYQYVISTLMLGVSHAVEVLVLGLLVVVFHTTVNSCVFNTVVVVACVIFIHVFSRCRGYWI